MASSSESSFGARLRKAQDLLTYLQGFTGYAPPRAQESVTGMTTLINSIIASNGSVSGVKQQFRSAVDQRHLAFKGTNTSVDKILTPIKAAVEAQYGRKSMESEAIASIIRRMRVSKLIKTPTNPDTILTETSPESGAGENTATTSPPAKKGISHSERSYGSMTQMFNDIISTLGQFTAYSNANSTLKITGLQTISAQLTTLNNAVAQKVQSLKMTRATRESQYADLKDRIERIKSDVKAQYGLYSKEYELVKGI